MKRTKKLQPNKTTLKAEIEYKAYFSKRTLFDYRLTDTESINLLRLLALTDNFYISQSETAKFLHISERTFKRVIKALKEKGYIEIRKNGNQYQYILSQESKYISAFNPKYIRYYNDKQLNAFLNNAETPTKYKNLILKYFDSIKQSEQIFEQTIAEIERFEQPTETTESNNENELFDYLGIKLNDDE